MTTSTIKLSEKISPAFYEVHEAIKNRTYDEYILKGGRGSTKSSFVSVEVIIELLKNKNIHAVILRKVANTMRTTVYNQYQWAIIELGLYEKFKFTVNPMEITYKNTGQKIMFFGMDDPGKIKSLKVPFGYVGIVHFEELDQFSGQEEIRNIEQSLLRGGELFFNFKSYNPPITISNWANKHVLIPKPGVLVHHSTFKTTPRHWLGEKFISDAEYLKGINPRAYKHEYLGVPTGTGGNVFENVKAKKVEASDIMQFDAILNGVDWGWYPDPFAFVRCQYNSGQSQLIIFDEFGANKLSNRETAEVIKKKGVASNDLITCDSSENKSVEDYRGYNLFARSAEKGPDSRNYSFKWLAGLREIIIDPERCPKTLEEFQHFEYERNKSGEVISGYPDGNDHFIDATRYATNRIWKRRGA
ncbi:MAG: PBSX family phage terminase large subunit [Eubacterium sp.]